VDHNNLGWYLATCPDAKVRDPQRALALAKRAVELAPKEGNNWNTLGVVQHYAGDKRAALSALYKSMELRRGGDSFDWFFLAMAHWQQGDKETARRWYVLANRWMAKYKPDDNELRRFRAEASTLLGMSEKIDSVPQIQPDEVELYTLITLRDPAAAWAYRERGRIHGGLCQWDAALSDYEKAHDLAPDDLPALAYPLGLLHLRAQQKDKYRQLCADLLARVGNRGNPNSAILIGILCKQAPEALADLSLPLKLVAQALAQRPTDRLGHGIHAHLLYRAGQHAESAKQLDELIRTDDVKSIHQPFNKLFLAKAQQRLGRLAEARKTLDEAIAWIDEHGQARLADGIILNEPQHWALRLEIQLLRQETEAVVGRTKSKD
jgi:tetratricopeptide (TPR) repeat protein